MPTDFGRFSSARDWPLLSAPRGALRDCINLAECGSHSGVAYAGDTVVMAVIRSADGAKPRYDYDVFARGENLGECLRSQAGLFVDVEPTSEAERLQRAQADAAEQRNRYERCRMQGIDETSGRYQELSPQRP